MKNIQKNQILLFEEKQVRNVWDSEAEKFWFSVVDVIGILTDQPTQRGASNYWAKLKERLIDEGADQLLTNCQQLKMEASDGKMRLTDVADTEQILRIIQSIPSKKVEPLKRWLAQVGRESKSDYFSKIWSISKPFISKQFNREQLSKLHLKACHLSDLTDVKEIIKNWIDIYIDFVKTEYQAEYKDIKTSLVDFIENRESNIKIVWGNCLDIMKGMKSESVHIMVTSPPYYNAREYSQWKNITAYLDDMRLIIREAYRVIDNHRVFVFNVGDIFDNDNISTKSTWGKRRIPLGAYFTKIFEEEGWTFVDDFIWDKGEVQSERHKNGNKPYPFYQYPMNCYEHILIFHKHRDDLTKYPCPVCGCLKVNGNAMSEIGLRSWECKNDECFERSKANRGKRFSLKTIMTQGNQEIENEIDKTFIQKRRRDIIKINPVIKINTKGENTLGHTAPFPSDIPEFAIKMFSYPGEYVLDPFGGSFTSIIEAKKLGRIGIGIELNKTMFREAGLKNIKKPLIIMCFLTILLFQSLME